MSLLSVRQSSLILENAGEESRKCQSHDVSLEKRDYKEVNRPIKPTKEKTAKGNKCSNMEEKCGRSWSGAHACPPWCMPPRGTKAGGSRQQPCTQRFFFREYLPLGEGASRRIFKPCDSMQRLKEKISWK